MNRAAPRPVARARRETRPPGPDPERLARLLVRAWLEVRIGRRPLAQLDPLVAPAVRRRLAAQLDGGGGDGTTLGRIVSVRTGWPRHDACEAAVLVEHPDGRTTAVAVRLERHRGAWRAAELIAPEAGLAPLSTPPLRPGWRERDAFDAVLEDVAAAAE